MLPGAQSCMARSPVILLEAPVTRHNKGAPEFRELLDFMDQRGYRLFDIAALLRPDGVRLAQMDAIFVSAAAALILGP